jgi:hypothetical protein
MIFNKFYFLSFLFLLVASVTQANEKIIFKLNDNQKVESSFSADIDQESSIHLLVFKDNALSKFGIKPFYIDEYEEVNELEIIYFKKAPKIVSFHLAKEDGILSLLTTPQKSKGKSLDIFDFNVVSGDVIKDSMYFNDEYITVRLPEKTILISNEEDNNKLKITTVNNSRDAYDVTYSFEGENLKFYKAIFQSNPDVININEFVENGSVKRSKLYIQDDHLIFDYKTDDSYKVMSLSYLFEEEPICHEIKIEGLENVKDVGTYIFDHNSFLFINTKEDIHLWSYDTESGENLMKENLNLKLKELVTEQSLENLIKKSKRGRFALTGTVNATSNQDMLVTIDYVDTRDYQYNYNWWFHHWFMQQQMMMQMQQQQMINQMNRQLNTMNSFGGPHPGSEDLTYNSVKPMITVEDNSIHFMIDRNFEIKSTNEGVPIRKKIYKEKIIDKLNTMPRIKHSSIAFTQNSARYIYFSKKDDCFLMNIETY